MADPHNNELVFPEDPTELTDADLNAIHDQAVGAFDALYGDGNVDDDTLTQLRTLADGIDLVRTELGRRAEAAEQRTEQANEIRSRLQLADDTDTPAQGDDGDDEEEEADSEEDQEEEPTDPDDAEQSGDRLAASARRRKPLRVNLSGLANRRQKLPAGPPASIRDVVMAAPDVPGFANGQGMDWLDMGRAVDARLTSFNHTSYEVAQRNRRHLRQQFGVAVIHKPFDDRLRARSGDQDEVDRAMDYATDETRLPGGSLTASSGWCAPSETLYDLFELEGRDGLFSLPEINVNRGGIKWTPGPDFATLFNEITGFSYTEDQVASRQFEVDADGVGTGDGEGQADGESKPCYHVPCTDFSEARMGVDGLCITAGLLQSRGYPELIARIIRGALIAHDNRMAGRVLAQIVAGSDAVGFPADQVGATAPILTAVELQAEHYKQVHRMGRNTSLEAVFPLWVHGAIRADLSRRLGVDLLNVTDAQINSWFTGRGINPQFVYNFQDLPGTPAATAYPTSVKFLIYAAGTWVRGGTDIITLDTIYDSMLLGQNEYTALFTEEGWLVAKRGHDSRVVTVPICPDGATGAGVAIACDGTESVPEAAE